MLTTKVAAATSRRLLFPALANRCGSGSVRGHLLPRGTHESSSPAFHSLSSAAPLPNRSLRRRRGRRDRSERAWGMGRNDDGGDDNIGAAAATRFFTSTTVVVLDPPLLSARAGRTPRATADTDLRSSSTSSVECTTDDYGDVPPPPLPPRFLRDADPANFDTGTHQRDASTLHFDLHSGKPLPPPATGASGGEEDDEDPRYRIDGCRVVSGGQSENADGGGEEDDILVVKWGDGVESRYPMESVEEWVDIWRGAGGGRTEHHGDEVRWGRERSKRDPSYSGDDRFRLDRRGRALWRNLTESDVRDAIPSTSASQGPVLSLPFHDVVNDANGSNRRALEALYRYGILLVTDTPVVTPDKVEAAAAIAAFASSVGGGTVKSNPDTSLLPHYPSRREGGDGGDDDGEDQSHPVVLPHGTDGPQRTLYGNVWYTTTAGQVGGTSVADSAYGSDGLPLHTDLTYYRDPAGLQLFAMIAPASSGGESVFADGFAVAEELRSIDEEAFRTLCLANRRYRCVDDVTGWHLQAKGTVIETSESDGEGEILSIRHNDLDRLPDLPPRWMRDDEHGAMEEYYDRLDRAHAAWDGLLGRDEFRLVMQLGPGDMVVVANRRVMHGRCSFVTGRDEPRSVIGCYVSQDELESRFRMEGFLID